MSRIYLSPPDVGPREREMLLDAFDSNWIAPLGPHVDAFEAEIASITQRSHAVATNSGTGALHLALRYFGVSPGDRVITSSLTFAATANAICYQGATPVFLDSCRSSWNMDPDLLREVLSSAADKNDLPRAVVAVDLYGQCADYNKLSAICEEFRVPLIVDAAESLGAGIAGRPAGSVGQAAIFSFNGNKIITTSGGGMLVTDDEQLATKARFWATQARDDAPHYQHSELGYNYRMSNILAAIGRAQLEGLTNKVDVRREHNQFYREALQDLPGITFMPEAPEARSTFWLTALLIDSTLAGNSRDDVRLALEAQDVEARPVWKPMHLQPLFAGCEMFGGAVCEQFFDRGLCLPSGSSLSTGAREKVVRVIREALGTPQL
ncbi:MAG: aminotransferase class I/II-fold pyridoxal phosphate-dependent enzyme [Myxococcales bacterium]|nr:aminotransferase class I/II-fold pyridoxal phosphate-dependent enzyme [Myxococcales bacterium]